MIEFCRPRHILFLIYRRSYTLAIIYSVILLSQRRNRLGGKFIEKLVTSINYLFCLRTFLVIPELTKEVAVWESTLSLYTKLLNLEYILAEMFRTT